MAYNLMYFFCCLQVDGPINLGGGGGKLVIGSLRCARLGSTG